MPIPGKVVIRRVGNSLGVLLPKDLIGLWGVGVGDSLEVSNEGIQPPGKKNRPLALDDLKLMIAMEVVSRFPVDKIRRKGFGAAHQDHDRPRRQQ